jgi:hypothetical protein
MRWRDDDQPVAILAAGKALLLRWWPRLYADSSAKAAALEQVLQDMADRVARAELHAEREQRRASREAERARAAELALIRLQDTLDHLRKRSRQTSGEACPPATLPDRHQARIAAGRRRVGADRALAEQQVERIILHARGEARRAGPEDGQDRALLPPGQLHREVA